MLNFYLRILFILPIFIIGLHIFGVRGCALTLSAESAILLESDSNTALYCKDSDKTMPMASTTKIMSALLTLERAELNNEVTITEEMVSVEGTSMGLLPGDTVSVYELVCGMLLSSGNDAANAAAIHIAGSTEGFAKLMNKRALDLGMTRTHFVTPSGLHADEHYSTAQNMALLGSYAIKNREFFNICSAKSIRATYGNPPYARTLSNHNKLLSKYDGAVGIKTGFTKKSGRCLVSAAKRGGITLVAVTLNAGDDWNDHIKLFDYGFSVTRRRSLRGVPGSEPLYGLKLPLVGGKKKSVSVVTAFEPEITVCDSYNPNIVCEIYLKKFEYADLPLGRVVGKAVYKTSDDGKVILNVPLVTAAKGKQWTNQSDYKNTWPSAALHHAEKVRN